MRKLVAFAAAVANLFACQEPEVTDARSAQPSVEIAPDVMPDVMAEDEALELTATECASAANLAKITASPSGSLLINSPEVVNDARAKGTGRWSFAYLMREILELPAPGTTPALLAAEQAKVDLFISRFVSPAAVNGFVPSQRPVTRNALIAAWGKVTGTDGIGYRTFANAPFKLVAMVNRLDIVKKGRTATTAGEGRFIFGFTGEGRMTVILEYDLPVAAASARGVANAAQWALLWHNLKRHLVDREPNRPGFQPDQGINAPLRFANKAGYLAALQAITELYANRGAQRRTGGTQAAIAQIRTNEFLQDPWELREIVRVRDAAGKPVLGLTTVKDTPDARLSNGGGGLAAWIAANVVCTRPGDPTSCRYNTADGKLPATIPGAAGPVRVLGATSPVSFDWFPASADPKRRFVALNTCSGCHQGETGTAFVHVDETNGAPSTFLRGELVKRARNLKNLVCLATASPAGLNLTDDDGDDTARPFGTHSGH